MTAEFRAGRFWFVVEEGGLRKLREPTKKINWCLSGAIALAQRQPSWLGAAPMASWVLARLDRLTDGSLQSILDKGQGNPGGGYSLKFTVLDADSTPVAAFSLNGNMNGVFVFGECRRRTTGAEVVTALVCALTEEPDAVMTCRVEVVNTSPLYPREDGVVRNCYGWDGEDYLGERNTR